MALGIGLVTAVAGIIAAIAAIAGIVTAPAAPVAAAGAILAAIATVASVGRAVFVEFQGVQEQATSLREESEVNTAFDGDRWPRATTEGEGKAD